MEAQKTLDARGLKCPMPILKAKKEIDATPPGDVLKVIATDPGSVLDFQDGSRRVRTTSSSSRRKERMSRAERPSFIISGGSHDDGSAHRNRSRNQSLRR